MRIRPLYYNYPHIKDLLVKILYLKSIIILSSGDTVLVTKNIMLKFVVTLLTLLGTRRLHIVENASEVIYLQSKFTIGTLIHDNTVSIPEHDIAIEIVIQPDLLFNTESHFKFCNILMNVTEVKYKALKIIIDADSDEKNFTYQRIRTGTFVEKAWNAHLNRNSSIVINNITYYKQNIIRTIDAIDSEFHKNKRVFVKFKQSNFEEVFHYMLYFFLRGELTDIGRISNVRHAVLMNDRKLKTITFVSDQSFKDWWHFIGKYRVYNPLNMFLAKWWITKWITKFTFAKILKNFIPEGELILLNFDRSLDQSTFLDQARRKVSVIYGTKVDGHTLGINRYNDKKLKIVNNSFTIMDACHGLDLKITSIGNLLIGGKRIPEQYKKVRSTQSKSLTDKYYLHGDYCKIHGDILIVNAGEADIYFDNNKESIVDVGTKRRALMSIPYIKRVMVFKHGGFFKAVVELDNEFLMEKWENPTLDSIKKHLDDKISELNSSFDSSEAISKVVINEKFFENLSKALATLGMSERNFIRYLNQ